MTLSAMSCNRYVLIVHPAHYRRVFTVRHSVLMCCCFYLVGFLLVCLNFFGVGDHSFDHKSLECFWDRMANHNYTIVFAVIMVWVPIIVTAVSYSKLFLHVRRVRMKVHSHGNNRSNAQVSNPGNDLEDNGGSNVENGQENHASDFVNSHENQDNGQCSSMTIAASNNAGKDGNKTEVQSDHNQGKPINLEEGDAKENDDDSFAHELHVVIVVWAHLHPSVNWVVYYHTNSKFRKAFRGLFSFKDG
nr:hypothetical protein BaRGS_014947 [Batillaria attramentaria]